MADKNRHPGPIPNRWLKCPRKALYLVADKFLAFKTPLNSRFDDQVPMDCRFPPKMLLETKMYRGKIGLWVDLTFTSRFYDKSEVESEDCKYIKLQCRGHGETPSVEQTDMFVKLVHNFIVNNPLKLIAVHCTHGFNRTGFLIVSYLVEKLHCSVESALQQFKGAREPGIYKEDYIRELYRRYEDVNDAPPPPQLPDWCDEEETADDLESTSENYKSEFGSSANHKRKKADPVFMEGVTGVTIFTEQPKAFHLQRKIQKMCGWQAKGFPGCQPISMDLDNIKLLNEKPYKVSWKADGTRYMMLIDKENEIYFFDRDNNVFKVHNIRFPRRKDLSKHLEDTLLDGEMVIDKVNGESIPRYLVYDIIKFEGQEVGKLCFSPVRLTCIQKEIIQPRQVAFTEGKLIKDDEPFSIRHKDFWDITKTVNLLSEKFREGLSHEPDGLIFQPSKDPYVAGKCDQVLKWKPANLNSVDFRLKIVTESGEGIVKRKIGQLYVGNLNVKFGEIKFSKAIKELDNKIIECKYENGQWTFMRERTDKSFPNAFATAKAVCKSINNPVTKEILLNFIDQNRFKNDHDLMPPPGKKMRLN